LEIAPEPEARFIVKPGRKLVGRKDEPLCRARVASIRLGQDTHLWLKVAGGRIAEPEGPNEENCA